MACLSHIQVLKDNELGGLVHWLISLCYVQGRRAKQFHSLPFHNSSMRKCARAYKGNCAPMYSYSKPRTLCWLWFPMLSLLDVTLRISSFITIQNCDDAYNERIATVECHGRVQPRGATIVESHIRAETVQLPLIIQDVYPMWAHRKTTWISTVTFQVVIGKKKRNNAGKDYIMQNRQRKCLSCFHALLLSHCGFQFVISITLTAAGCELTSPLQWAACFSPPKAVGIITVHVHTCTVVFTHLHSWQASLVVVCCHFSTSSLHLCFCSDRGHG